MIPELEAMPTSIFLNDDDYDAVHNHIVNRRGAVQLYVLTQNVHGYATVMPKNRPGRGI